MFLAALLTKLYVLIINLVSYKGENAAFEFIKAILKEYKYCKKQRTNSLRKI